MSKKNTLPFFIGIAGGSGTGKTKLALALKKYFGKEAAVLHLDKYQKFGQKLPTIHGMKNWDHPRSVDWKKLASGLTSPRFSKYKVVIVEGYLLFYKPALRRIFDFKIYLKASDSSMIKRRLNSKVGIIKKIKDRIYIKKVLLPMHRKYIEPTRKFADLVLNTEKHPLKKCLKLIVSSLKSGASIDFLI